MRTPAQTLAAAALIGATGFLAPASAQSPGSHGPDCICRAPSRIAQVGETVCLNGRLARCVMVLNNTSWQFTAEPCPVSRLPEPDRKKG